MPTLFETITERIAAAMKQKDAASLAPLRMLKAALMNREVEKGRPLDEAESLQVVASLVKQRRDAVEQFTSGGRMDLADREQSEIELLERYLPPAADDARIETAIDAAIAETGASTVKDMGKVMKATLVGLAGLTVDGRKVSEFVKRRLSSG
jgi:uncharacterized protein YqeY